MANTNAMVLCLLCILPPLPCLLWITATLAFLQTIMNPTMTVYMVIAAGVSVTALNTGFNITSNLFGVSSKYVLDILTGLTGGVEHKKDELLYMIICCVKRVKLFCISLQFILLTFVIFSMIFVEDAMGKLADLNKNI